MLARLLTKLEPPGRLEVAWLAFAVANLAAMGLLVHTGGPPGWETVPFHFVFVSFTILYGFRTWRTSRTILGIVFVGLTTGAMTYFAISAGREGWPEETEVPLMSLMFLSMVFHARRRQQAIAVAERLAGERAADLERQRAFLSDASHELKTPITIARGSIDVLLRTHAPSPEDVDETLSIASAELARMGRLIERLLLLAGADASDRFVPRRTDAADFVNEVRTRWSMLGDRKVRQGPTAAGTVLLDRDQAMLAVDAAVENCFQHTRPGDPLELSSHADGERLVIEIRDWGPGVSPADLPHLFERFYRPDRARNRRHGGAGLGLAIVDAIVRAHGGAASVRSVLGEGTVVSLAFPGYVRGVAQDVAAPTHGVDVDEHAELAT
jgi:signal transduction histidine kinase